MSPTNFGDPAEIIHIAGRDLTGTREAKLAELDATKSETPSLTEHYVVPARHLSGTRDEVLAQIDEIMLGLAALRQFVSLHGPTRPEAPRPKRLVKGLLSALLLLSTVI
jgi:hypothetical protein